MQETQTERFRNTFEAAHGRQEQSPFSSVLTGQINWESIAECLDAWKRETSAPDPWLDQVKHWIAQDVDPELIEQHERIPPEFLAALRQLGCFGARIPTEYGGLGMSQRRYSRLLETLGSASEVLALVVSVQQLGVAQGLLSAKKLERNLPLCDRQQESLREKYLSWLAHDAIGAFCLTTPETGSDPSRLQTIARASADGSCYFLEGDAELGGKLYTTLGTIADVYIMLALVVYPGENPRDVDPKSRITAFLVERRWPGISVNALRFCGWRGLPNAAIRLDQVCVPAANRLGRIGDGLKIAFMNLGSGRVNISSIALGMMKQLTRVARWWGVERVQGGKPIAEHELNADDLVGMTASIYASESFLQFCAALADRPGADIRLEAAMLKLFASHELMKIADQTLQLRGGRGYETHASQKSRGETPVAVERLFRSARMMQIGEGGSNVLKLYIARCLLDEILQFHARIREPGLAWTKKCGALFKAASYFLKSELVGRGKSIPAIASALRPQADLIQRRLKKLNRVLLRNLLQEGRRYVQAVAGKRFGCKSPEKIKKPEQNLEEAQVFLANAAQIALLLSVMAVTLMRASREGHESSIALADEFCNRALEETDRLFKRIQTRSASRARRIQKLNREILNGIHAEATEGDIETWILPGIRQSAPGPAVDGSEH